MSAKDIYHDIFVRALQKDGWNITHDLLHLPLIVFNVTREEITRWKR